MNTVLRFYSKLIVSLLFLLGLSHAAVVHADPVVFVRDYTYNASENDSKVSARKAALEQLQRAVIEEVGIQVQASFSNTESYNEGQLKQDVLSNFSTFSQALTKTKILEEKWNGETFYIKASIEVDPDGVTGAINALAANQPDLCTANKEKVSALLKKPANIARNQALVDVALTTHFDEDCNQWQYTILSALTADTDYPIADYQAFIFAQLNRAESYDLPKLMPKVIYYAIRQNGDITANEWEIIEKEIQRIPAKYVFHVLRSLSNLETESYQQKIDDVLQLSANGKLAEPAVDTETVVNTIIKASLKNHTQLVAQLYLDYAEVLSDKNKQASIVRKIYEKGHSKAITTKRPELTKLSDKVIKHFLTNTDLEQLDSRAVDALYSLVRPLMNEKRSQGRQSHDNQHLKDLLKNYPNQFAYFVESQRIAASTKNLFLLKYNLPAVNLCQPAECIEQVFNRDLTLAEQNTYLEYLVAYGEKASEVEKSVIRLLDRAQIMSSSVHRSQRKKALITILSNIKSTDPNAINLLIKSLEDFDYKVPDDAIEALALIGLPAFELMAAAFPDSKELSQRRMVEAMGQMKPAKDIVQFLKSIPVTDNEHMRFAVEDAIDAQTRR